MPKRKSNLYLKSNKARRVAESRQNETAEEREARLLTTASRRAFETPAQREARQAADAERTANSRAEETPTQRETRQARNAERTAASRAEESPNQREVRQARNAERTAASRAEETPNQREVRQAINAERTAASRAEETPTQHDARQARNAERTAASRAEETPTQREVRQAINAERTAASRAEETPTQHDARQARNAERTAASRAEETPTQRDARQARNAERTAVSRAEETPTQREDRHINDNERHLNQILSQTPEEHENHLRHRREERTNFMRMTWDPFRGICFSYNPDIPYSSHGLLQLGIMNIPCRHCGALKWKGESVGLCCTAGKVRLPTINEPPEPLRTLLIGETPLSTSFLQKTRQYNSCFQMTSFGTSGPAISYNFPTTFTAHGQIYHRFGSLLPAAGQQHSFLQVYFIGDEHLESARRHEIIPGLSNDIVHDLQHLLHTHNQLIHTFKVAMEQWPEKELKVVIRADRRPPGEHERRFNAPTTNEVAAVVISNEFESRDIVLRRRDETLVRVSETHRFYDALQYPLIFWQGQEGYHFCIPKHNPVTNQPLPNKKVTALEFYAFYFMVHNNAFNTILRFRQLLNQFVVDMYVKIESERLFFIKRNQSKLRSDNYIHLQDAVASDGNVNPNNVGQLVILPSSFTGSPRYMHEHAQDALAYVRQYGRPDLFITMTCNPKWDEITLELLPGQRSIDRHDIVARVFRQKVTKFVTVITKGEIFGSVKCWMYTVEWQKRGLPHIHALIWCAEKIQPNQIDLIISAEIPNDIADPHLNEIVLKNMVHGPCGALNMNSPCMKHGKCSKGYPRALINNTQTSENGYPLYRRRRSEDGGNSAQITMASNRNDPIVIDNSWIVPYCPVLSKIFNAHINVEYCSSVKSIKYVCKYIHKGSDQAVFNLRNQEVQANLQRNEVEIYQTGRYVSSNEAFWRIFSFPVHERYPTVTHLSVHLENGQRIYFHEDNMQEKLLNPPNTTLTAFFKLCENDPFARTLLYPDVPHYYTWNPSTREFKRRLLGEPVQDQPGVKFTAAIGRVYTVHPNNMECFCLRILLHKIRGPKSFIDLRTVGNTVFETYKETCQTLGLLEDDRIWENTLEEAVQSRSPSQVRYLFSIMLSSCGIYNPTHLWETFKYTMSEDILYKLQLREMNDIVYNDALRDIEKKVFEMCGKKLSSFGLPNPQTDVEANSEIVRELSYNTNQLQDYVAEMVPKLSAQQRKVYDTVINKVKSEESAVFFLDAPGGTGKTFLMNVLLATIRKEKKIAIAVASSGIAATLLPGGRTAHSMFKLPLNFTHIEVPTCNISKDSERASLLRQCQLIVWDECTMSHKRALEALDRSLRDIRGNNSLMGGLVVLMAGDFRQTLPVIQRGTPADEINACLKSSHLWNSVSKLHLTHNMRVHLHNDSDAGEFSSNLLKIGEGKIPKNSQQMIELPRNFCNIVNSTEELISSVFPDIEMNYLSSEWLCSRTILSPLNDTVNTINNELLKKLPSEEVTFLSIDNVVNEESATNYPTEFLNSLELTGVPSHKLYLKVGAPVLLMRNLDAPRLCNGTRLVITALKNNLITARIMTGCAKGETVIIPRIPIIPTDLPFQFKRLQFPLKLAFAMTINKAQGQTMQFVGINLEKDCFSHGQLYVACSRVSSGQNLHIFSPKNNKVFNVVYKNVLYK